MKKEGKAFYRKKGKKRKEKKKRENEKENESKAFMKEISVVIDLELYVEVACAML